jgi:1,4-alpha-glucan branching enzyme
VTRIGPVEATAPTAPSVAADGRTRFSMEAPGAVSVTLAGDFTEWEEVTLRREGAAWTATLRLEPGVYRYAYRVDGRWHVPEGTAGRTRDEWGNPVATLVVPGS